MIERISIYAIYIFLKKAFKLKHNLKKNAILF